MGQYFGQWDCAGPLLEHFIPHAARFTLHEVPPGLLGDLALLARHSQVEAITLAALASAEFVCSRPPVDRPSSAVEPR